MNHTADRRLLITGGISGIISIMAYVIVTVAPLTPTFAFLLAMLWPLLSIVYAYALYSFIATEREGSANRIGFVLAVAAFSMVAMMISVQLAVKIGMAEYRVSATADEIAVAPFMTDAIRLVDLGLDLAWDFFIGATLIVVAFPMSRHSKLGYRWGVPSGVLGALLIGLNAATFPWPPDTRGLVDIGPLIGLYVVLLSTHLVTSGIKMERGSL